MSEPMLDSILKEVDDSNERARLQETWERLGELEPAEPSPELARRFARMVEFSRSAPPRSSSLLRRMLPVAAALVVGSLIGTMALRMAARTGEQEVRNVASGAHAAWASRALASSRLAAVETLAALPEDAEVGRMLTEVATTDPSIGVRLVAIDAVERYVADDEVARRLIATVPQTDSTLIRIRLIELFVDHRIDAARTEIESLHRDPQVDDLVRRSAGWAINQL